MKRGLGSPGDWMAGVGTALPDVLGKEMRRGEKKRQRSGPPVRLLRVGEVAEMLGVHPNTVRMWSDDGTLPSYRFGPRRDRRFMPEDIMRFITEQKVRRG